MRPDSLRCLIFGIVLLPTFSLVAAEDKNDLILEELRLLRQSIERLEQRLGQLEQQGRGSGDSATPSATRSTTDDPGLVGRVMDAITLREEAVHLPWLDAQLWSQLKNGLSPDQVQAILGKPTLEEPSLHPRRDLVYTYRGRRVATGERVSGKVKFSRGKVVVIEPPEFDD